MYQLSMRVGRGYKKITHANAQYPRGSLEATYLLARQRFAIFLVELANANHRVALELGDLKSTFARDLV